MAHRYFLIGVLAAFCTLWSNHLHAQVVREIDPKKAEHGTLAPPSSKLRQMMERGEQAQQMNVPNEMAPSPITRDTTGKFIRISLLLPFDQNYSSWKIYGYLNEEDPSKIETHRLKAATREVFDYYEGFSYAVQQQPAAENIQLFAFDSYSKDSILEEVLHNDTIKASDIIIGPGTASQAKITGAFCKKNHIINIQPLVASKSIVNENPYLVRLLPTIDAHMQKIFETIRDSFTSGNVIIYTTKRERDIVAAKAIDSLFRNYNATHDERIRVFFINAGDTTKSAKEKSIANYLSPRGKNVVVLCCYDETLVNSTIRQFDGEVALFGMPTWTEAEQIRPDILSRAQPFFTDPFYADTTSDDLKAFERQYETDNGHYPSKYAYLGYDTWNYLNKLLQTYGIDFRAHLTEMPFSGKGYNFQMVEIKKPSKQGGAIVTGHYENTGMHLFKIEDYQIHRVD
ncbi:MAG: ABC transporter substrate-binding protein [Chitinophagales bacterium]